MEHGEGIVGAEEEAFMNLRIVAKVQQHAHTIGQCQRGDIGVEMWVAFREVLKGRTNIMLKNMFVV